MKFISPVFFLLLFCKLAAQQAMTDSAFYSQSVSNSLAAYRSDVRENLHIYNGSAYLRTGHSIKGTPFFQSDSLLPGAVIYDGRLYENLLLQYDMVTDQVIIRNYQQVNELQLVPEKLPWFYIGQHVFVRIPADSSTPSFITTGFYEKLHDGRMTVFARRQKVPRQANDAADNKGSYAVYNSYFLLLNDVFYQANDKNDFLSLMGPEKEAVAKYIKENKINFRKRREVAMVQVAAYYDKLKSKNAPLLK